MVAYRLSAQVIGRSTGRSATGAAAYRAACRIEDERTGLTRDYTRKGGVLHTEILAPKNVPDWMRDRAKLWNAIEQAEKRKDAQLCREILLNLPHELTREQQTELVREFVRDQCVALGMIADLAIHAPHRKGDDRNTHAHVMLTMREVTPQGFGQKVRDWNSPELLEQWREQWAHYQNRALERAGRSERVDHRSLEAQGIDREPEPKQGPVATQMEREGRPSKAGDDRRAAKARNEQRAELKAEAKIIDLELARIEREERERQPSKPALPPAVIYRQKARFETRANARRADLQNRRLGAEGQQGRGHDRQRIKLERQQESTYGKQLEALNSEAAAITARQRQGARGLRGMAYRVTGRAARDRDRAAGIQASLGSIEQRKTEQLQALNAEQQADRAELAGRYIGLAVQLEKRIEQRRAEREAEGWIPPEARREATTGQEIGQATEIDREAENSPVEGREAGAGETAPREPEAPHAPPEQAQEAKTGKGQESTPKIGWTPEERAAAIEAERERQAQADRERGSNDNDRGREIE
jgi:MobA/MobL family protein